MYSTEELEKWDLPKIDAIQQKIDTMELEQKKVFNAVLDMRSGSGSITLKIIGTHAFWSK